MTKEGAAPVRLLTKSQFGYRRTDNGRSRSPRGSDLKTGSGVADLRVRVASRSLESGGGLSTLDAELLDAAPELQYGGSTFLAASEYLRALRQWREPTSVQLGKTLIDFDGYRALLEELRGLHSISVGLSDSPAGDFIARYLGRRRRGVTWNRVAQGVLLLPPTFPEYVRGRARQAMRTNNRAATAEGISCHRLEHHAVANTFQRWSRRGVLTGTMARTYHYKRPAPNEPRDVRWYMALDGTSSPVGYAKVWVDTNWALMDCMVCVSHPARWLLHTHIVEDMCAAGVSYLFVDAGHALRMPPSLQYFQRRLGYRVAHLRVPPSSRDSRLTGRYRGHDPAPKQMRAPRAAFTALAATVPPWLATAAKAGTHRWAPVPDG